MDDKQEKEPIVKFKEQLDNKLWITRKCRINASERLLKSAKFVDFVNVYYSIFLILVSLISVSPYAKNADSLSYISLAGSITLTISIIYASTLRFNERSEALKQNYIALQGLIDRLKLTKADDESEIREINQAYCELLSLVENHENIDYLELLRSGNVEGYSLTKENWLRWISYVLWHSLIKFVLIAAPIGCIIFVLC